MKLSAAAVLLVGSLSGPSSSFATEQAPCEAGHFTEAKSLAELPQAVGELLGSTLRGLEGIAERGARFNRTDVVNPELPMRRLSVAAVNQGCVVAAVERGGRGYSVEVWAFEHSERGWRGAQRSSLGTPPGSMQELIAHASK